MATVLTQSPGRPEPAGYKVDLSRGERIGRVSSEWFSRPADERYLSLSNLFAAVRTRIERSRSRTVESAAIRVETRISVPAVARLFGAARGRTVRCLFRQVCLLAERQAWALPHSSCHGLAEAMAI